MALALSVAVPASAEDTDAAPAGAVASSAETADLHPESAGQAELETLRLRERYHFTHRRAYAYSVLGGGVVFTVGLAVLVSHVCVLGCPPNVDPIHRAGAGLVVGGLAIMLVSSLAVVVHTGTLREVRRRMFELRVAPTAWRGSAGAQLSLTW